VEPITEADTNVAVQATARYARSHDVTRVIVITYRSHTRRTALLLRRALGQSAVVIVRASQIPSTRRPGGGTVAIAVRSSWRASLDKLSSAW
jgi:uncharacterized SAM-binding protein YcdF (DUF218 family)